MKRNNIIFIALFEIAKTNLVSKLALVKKNNNNNNKVFNLQTLAAVLYSHFADPLPEISFKNLMRFFSAMSRQIAPP